VREREKAVVAYLGMFYVSEYSFDMFFRLSRYSITTWNG
jgi:hypothetical protein